MKHLTPLSLCGRRSSSKIGSPARLGYLSGYSLIKQNILYISWYNHNFRSVCFVGGYIGGGGVVVGLQWLGYETIKLG